MYETLAGISTVVKLRQLVKAYVPMLLTPSVITTEVMEDR